MRTIKFRGKEKDEDEWLYGDLRQRMGYWPGIIESYCTDEGKVGYREVAVEEETVGQFTGMHDKCGDEIYEGDIVMFDDEQENGVVVYDEKQALFGLLYDDPYNPRIFGLYDCKSKELEVVGNIYDDPEMIKH